jgi:hypothetical protein
VYLGFFGMAAATFQPSFNATLSSIRVAGTLINGPDNFNAYIAPDAGGVPGAPLESFTGLTFAQGAPGSIFTLGSALHPLLSASQVYWVVMPLPNDPNSWAGWNANSQGYLGVWSSNNFSGFVWNFQAQQSTLAFEVDGTAVVPEPATFGMGLVILVLAGVSGALRYRAGASGT